MILIDLIFELFFFVNGKKTTFFCQFCIVFTNSERTFRVENKQRNNALSLVKSHFCPNRAHSGLGQKSLRFSIDWANRHELLVVHF